MSSLQRPIEDLNGIYLAKCVRIIHIFGRKNEVLCSAHKSIFRTGHMADLTFIISSIRMGQIRIGHRQLYESFLGKEYIRKKMALHHFWPTTHNFICYTIDDEPNYIYVLGGGRMMGMFGRTSCCRCMHYIYCGRTMHDSVLWLRFTVGYIIQRSFNSRTSLKSSQTLFSAPNT